MIVFVATVHGVHLEDELCIGRCKFYKRLGYKLDKLLHALKIGALGDLAVCVNLQRHHIILARPSTGKNPVETVLLLTPPGSAVSL